MSTEHSPAKATDAIAQGGDSVEADLAYWNTLIDEKVAGDHIGLTDRTMQKFRQQGGGPPYIVISSRCIRYRRRDLEVWANARLRSSTSDPGQAAA